METDDKEAGGFHCGYATILGRPNVGKSTLLNSLLGQKLSITSRRPQTTRWHMLGVDTGPKHQIIYVDTPGLQNRHRNALNRHMTQETLNSIEQVDLLVFVVEALKWTDADEYALNRLMPLRSPCLLVINKIDKVGNKDELLPYIGRLRERYEFSDIIPVSARTGVNLDDLKRTVVRYLPSGPALFPEDQLTDKSERFLAAEIIREKLTRKLGSELPYRITVTTDEFKEAEKLIRIHATVWVENAGQKPIVIGKDGRNLKSVGEQARYDMENLFAKQVYLEIWVKVKRKWTEQERAIRQLGYQAEPGDNQ